MKAFRFILIRKFAKNLSQKDMRSKTPSLAYTHPVGGVLYIGMAWGGMFISVRAFGDAYELIN